jgi:predicted RNA-binding protein with PIN domain
MARWAKLPPSARPTVRRVLDDDEEFRARVVAATADIELPAAAKLFVERPDGWREQLAGHLEQARQEQAEEASGRADRVWQRRLEGAEAARARLEEKVTAVRIDLARSADELADERRTRRDAEERAESSARRLAAAESERDRARRRAEESSRAAQAERQVIEAERDELRTERDRLRSERDRLEAELASHAERPQPFDTPPMPAVSMPAPSKTGDVPGASSAIAAAADAAQSLARALAAAAIALDGNAAQPPGAPPAPAVSSGSSEAAVRRRRATARRRPQPLPPAVFDDSSEAAEHLVRVPGMLVLVDGYNVTLNAWEELPISTQRSRLVDACGELAARSGAEILIVFDGAEEPGDLPLPMGRGRVRWRFSPPDVEADDVLLELVLAIEPERPVMVASSDRRVRDGARTLGANAISTPQLLAVLRRDSARRRG